MTNEQDATADDLGWARLWVPVENQLRAELEAREAPSEPQQEAVALTDVTETPCLVLLGEAGMGKTHEINGLAARLRDKGEQVDLLHGGDPGLPAALDALLRSEHQRLWSRDDRPWHILIDGVDEISRAPLAPERFLADFFDRLFASHRKIAFLRVVLTCRTSAWTEALDQLVEERWPADCYIKLVLEPLGESDIRNAVERVEPAAAERERLSGQLLDQKMRAVASRPLLLALLLRSHRAGTPLPAGQADLLQRAIEQALSGSSEPDLAKRLTIAARLAAAGTFADFTRFTTALGPADPGSLAVARIAGGVEPMVDGSITATPALLSQCLRSVLFIEIEAGVFEWSHRTFSDFLTARYLAEHRLSADQILSLLNVQEVGGPGGIAPHLLEVAGWAATMVPPFFDILLERQPDVLLRSQAAVLEPEDRARLTAAILKRFASGDLLDQYEQLGQLLGVLDHPGLVEQLRPIIADPTTAPFERRAAIDIAAATGKDALSSTLVDVAADPGTDGLIRMMAARAVSQLSGDKGAARLGPILTGDLSSDTEDRLRGTLLKACWPDHVSFRNLLGALTVPKQINFIGHYQLFLYRFVAPQMTAERALDSLSWLQRRLDVDDGNHGPLLPVMAKLFWASGTQIADATVRKAMAAFIVAADHELNRIVSADRKTPNSWPDEAHVRSDLVQEVLMQASDPHRASAVLVHNLPDLVRPSDLDAILARLPAISDEAVRAALSQIAIELVGRLPIDSLGSVWDTALRVPELQQRLTQRNSVELDSVATDYKRQGVAREREAERLEAQEKTTTSIWLSTVSNLLDRIEAGEPELWWQLNLQLFHEPGGGYDPQFEFETDLTRTPGWQALREKERERILRSAPSYLIEAPLTDLSWLGTSTSHRPANAGLRALHLLRDQAPDLLNALAPETWAAWAPAILGFFGNDFYADGNVQRALLRDAYRIAPEAVLSTIRQIATGEVSAGLTSRVFELLEGMLDAPLATQLEDLRGADDLKGQNAASDILSFLVRNGDTRSTTLVHAALAKPPMAGEDRSSAEKASLAKGAVELLLRDPGETWLALLELRDRDETFARSIWKRFAKEVAFDRSFAPDSLSEYALAQAYIDLAVLLPERPPDATGARVLGVPDYVEQLRSVLLSRLIATGTNAALEQLYRVQQALPGARDSLRWSIEEARRNVRSKSVRREDPADILARIGDMGAARAERKPKPEPEAAVRTDDTDLVPFEVDIPAPQPAPIGPLPVEQQRTILAVATEWASHHGGISTLNRELCGALAALGHTVMCLVPEASELDVNDAKGVSVELLECPRSVGVDGHPRFLLCMPEHLDAEPELVIGHDHITGIYARALAERFGAKYLHFLHTIPQENEGLKSPHGDTPRDVMDGEIKMENQLLLAGSADLVVAVGPRIQKYFLWEAVEPPPVTVLIPGLNPDLLTLVPDHKTLQVNSCLMSGRMEDAGVKGGLLACDVIKMVANEREWGSGQTPVMVMRGFTKAKANAEFAKIGDFASYSQFVHLRSFSTDPVKLRQGYLNTALIIMPSVAEGFGLTGLEAIAAGVPVIISASSGLAEYLLDPSLNQGLNPALVLPCIAPVTLDDASNRAVWAEKVDAALFDHAVSFERAASLRNALKARLTWDNAARKLSADFHGL